MFDSNIILSYVIIDFFFAFLFVSTSNNNNNEILIMKECTVISTM